MSLEITLICFGLLAIVVGYELNHSRPRSQKLGQSDDLGTAK
jgi:hypothetical protein